MEVTGVPAENQSNPKSLASFSHAATGIQTHAVVRQQEVNGNALDHMAIRAGSIYQTKNTEHKYVSNERANKSSVPHFIFGIGYLHYQSFATYDSSC